MIEWEWEQKVKHRITCDEVGYPLCESQYIDVKDWENQTGGNWVEDILSNGQAQRHLEHSDK